MVRICAAFLLKPSPCSCVSRDESSPPQAVNPHIKELAQRPRGKPWASRLCVHEEEIRRRRKAHHSYREIALWLAEEQGLSISAASIHAFVRARARRRQRRQYELPEPAAPAAPAPRPRAPATADAADPFSPAAPAPVDPFTVNLKKPHGQET